MKLVALLTVVTTAFGCAIPQPVVRLHPQSDDVVWRSGRAIVTGQLPGLRIAIAFDHLDEARIAFRVEVENVGADRIDIDPGQIGYRLCTTPQSCSPIIAVADPERALLALDVARSQERAGQTNDAVAGTALLLLGATAAVASAGSGDRRQAHVAVAVGAAGVADAADSIDRREAAITTIEMQKNDWAASALRRTTLFPGQGLAGLVYVPVEPNATAVWLRIQARGRSAWFPFQQVVVARPPV